MARWQPVPVVGGAYTDDCKPWASQDCVNRIPVMAEREGTRSPAMLRDAPGCAVLSILGSDAPIRGLHNAEGKLFAVSGQTLYLISVTGAATSLGTIPGVGRVRMAHNQIAGGNEVAIANGQSGYVYNTVTGVLAQITDAGFPGAKVFDFCDGYMMFVEPQGRYWGHSNLAAATDFNALDRSEAEAQPDKIVTGIVSHRQWIVFGERSTEFYDNTGATTGTFQRAPGTVAEVGAAGTFAVAKLDNTVFVVGHDGVGYRLDGYHFIRITTHAIEQAWARCDLSQAYSYVFDDRGHKVWYVTMADGQTWGFDVATNEWHRRKSYGLDFWRMADLVRWNGRWIGGDYSNGKLYQLDWRLSNDAGEPLERSRTFAVMHDSQNRVHLNALELVYDTGITDESPPLPLPVAGAPILRITGNLPDGAQGDVESYAYTITGGTAPVTAAITSGALPTGLSMDAAGVITGTRTAAGVFSWTVLATDANGLTASLDDVSTTTSAQIFVWRWESGLNTASASSADVSGDVIAIGYASNHISYSTDRGNTWATVAPHPSSMLVSGLCKYAGDWYAFGQFGGVARAAMSPDDTFVFGNLPISFTPANAGSSNHAFVMGAHLYVGIETSFPGTYKLARYDGAAWTTIDTGVSARAAAHGINRCAQSGGFFVLGTSDGTVMRTADFVTFGTIFTTASVADGIKGIGALGAVVVVGDDGGNVRRSTDNAATFGAPYVAGGTNGGTGIIANGFHLISGGGFRICTSLTGESLSWTERLDSSPVSASVTGMGAASSDLAVYGTANGYALIGDVA